MRTKLKAVKKLVDDADKTMKNAMMQQVRNSRFLIGYCQTKAKGVYNTRYSDFQLSVESNFAFTLVLL